MNYCENCGVFSGETSTQNSQRRGEIPFPGVKRRTHTHIVLQTEQGYFCTACARFSGARKYYLSETGQRTGLRGDG